MNQGTRLGPYEIVAPIGAGGMGEVFKARDTRLDRSVAVKVLPAEFAQNAQLKLRFEREAKTISQLEHPNICRLYDVGEAALDAGPAQSYLVMELLEGESLADRLARGPLPLADVLRFGMQIADALDRAHRVGIVHRDLKPGNVMLTRSGAKLLDFGLSKAPAVSNVVKFASAMEGATQQKPLTEQGTIVGTFQYMAPEQLEGAEADARTDIFAFGAVMYEMATGQRAFKGETRTSLIAAIVSGEPAPISEVQPLAPPALDHIIRKCLSKDPEERWQSARDIAEEIRWVAEAGSKAGLPATIGVRRIHRERLAWGLAAVAVMAAALSTFGYLRRAPKPEPVRRFALGAPPQTSLIPFDELGLAVSPDGERIAFAAISSDGRRQLWLRSFSDFDARPLPDTANASYPFWSPDGRFIAFFADGKLKKIDAAGGPPQVICDAASGRGGSWGAGGTILFAPNIYSGIYSIQASGGVPKPVTKLDPAKEVTHRWPHILPGGTHFLYVSRPRAGASGRGPGRLLLASFDSAETKVLMEGATNTVYANGYLLFGRDQRLMAQKFDAGKLAFAGDAVVLVGEKLSFWEPKNLVIFSVSETGSLVFLPETPPLANLRILSRDGRPLDTVASASLLGSGARFSHDGSRLAYSLVDKSTGRGDIWIYDLVRKRPSRFTFQPGDYWGVSWTRDGSRLYFASSPQSMGNLFQKPLKGSAAIQPVVESGRWIAGGEVSPDGRSLLYAQQSPDNRNDLWKLTFGGKPEMFLATPFDESEPAYSPDGRWVAFSSNESGRSEVYVRPVAGTPDQWQISAAGGTLARWRADGREIIYITPEGAVMSVPVRTSPAFESGEAVELFALGVPSDLVSGSVLQDLSPDGQRIAVILPSENVVAAMRAIFNWKAGLK